MKKKVLTFCKLLTINYNYRMQCSTPFISFHELYSVWVVWHTSSAVSFFASNSFCVSQWVMRGCSGMMLAAHCGMKTLFGGSDQIFIHQYGQYGQPFYIGFWASDLVIRFSCQLIRQLHIGKIWNRTIDQWFSKVKHIQPPIWHGKFDFLDSLFCLGFLNIILMQANLAEKEKVDCRYTTLTGEGAAD